MTEMYLQPQSGPTELETQAIRYSLTVLILD